MRRLIFNANWVGTTSQGDKMKYQVDTLDGLDESVSGLYKEQDGKFVLNVEGMPQQEDVSGLKAKVDELLGEKKKADQAKKEAEKAAEQARIDAERNSGDIEAVRKSYEEQIGRDKSDWESEKTNLMKIIETDKVDNVAMTLATELAGDKAEVLIPHIRSRLAVERRDDSYVTTVIDKNGKPCASSVNDLKSEFANNNAFSGVIIASQASGGGATGSNHGSGAAKTITRSQFDQLGASERMAHIKDGGSITND